MPSGMLIDSNPRLQSLLRKGTLILMAARVYNCKYRKHLLELADPSSHITVNPILDGLLAL